MLFNFVKTFTAKKGSINKTEKKNRQYHLQIKRAPFPGKPNGMSKVFQGFNYKMDSSLFQAFFFL